MRPREVVSPGTRVEVYDTTLRDGTQREGISLTCGDKLRIARRLDELGVAFIEAGWPGSNPKDVAFFERARDVEWTTSSLVAFGATRRADVVVEDDPGLRALLQAKTPVCTLFGKSSTLQVKTVLRATLDENLRMIEESVAFLRASGRRVIYDAEHFFDGWALDRAYALETLRAAARGGAETIVLCDTNGGTLPFRVAEIVFSVAAVIDRPLGIHAHDDGGCAVANSLMAVHAGARQVQGTINGYGERCGNANLCALVPDLELKLGMRALPEDRLRSLFDAAHFVAEIANCAIDEHMPYVGRSAFAHKGGVHVAAMRRDASAYQHVDPALVGNAMRVVVSELSGRGSLLSKAEELDIDLPVGAETQVLEHIKEREAEGASFEVAEASVALLLRRQSPGYRAPFRLIDYNVVVGKRSNVGAYAEATIKIAVGDDVLLTAAEGCGPVRALDAALRKALEPAFPELSRVQLADYKVRILDGREGTSATTRVLIDSRDDREAWSTVGASSNIIEASWHALTDGIEYGLLLAEARRTEVA
jgi:2-isopropylmalate synthase